MTRQLVLVHGRSQQQLDSDDLKKSWIDAFCSGLEKNGLDLPIDESDIRFPYYGDTLHDLVSGIDEDQIAEVVVKGDGDNSAEAEFARQMIEEIRNAASITDEDVREAAGSDSLEKGWQNWEWVQNVLEVLDQRLPGASKLTVALATKDVYAYLRNPGFQGVIDRGVSAAITAGVETVVVGHSLGSVVSYNLLVRDGKRLGWKVPLYVTLGSPLAVKVIKQLLSPIKHPTCVEHWFNAMDKRDIVSLYALDETHFPVDPAIENKTDVDNFTDNRHGIAGYLSDKVVAKRIYDALTA
ncbi:MAG TPA: alpha/beta hydrolase [Planctomycetaceae bacterium]|nr:alpha/beta hydrolase [Planctomycetaceae bacterium]